MSEPSDLALRTTAANGIEFAYLEAGPDPDSTDPDAPLAVCLHGYPDTAWTWRHLLPRLADAGFRAVAPFNRGYAPSSLAADGRYQAGVLGVDANALHEVLGGDERSVVIGHDWGAMGAYAAAHLDPSRWSKVVAAAVPPGPVTAGGFLDYDQLRRSWYMFFQLTPLADMVVPMDDFSYIARIWQDWSPGFDGAEDVARFVESMDGDGRVDAALAYYRQTLQPELQDPLLADAQAGAFAMPSQPLLYLHGTDDGCMSAELAATTGDHLVAEGSRAVMISDAGHFLQLEQPDRFNDEVLDFLL